MKTTIELEDRLLRRAKAHAAARGISLREFFAEAVEDRLRRAGRPGGRPGWTAVLGGLSGLRRETARISAVIDAEFERVDTEDE